MCQLRIQQAVCCFCRQQFFFALRAYVIQLRFGCVKALGKRERHIQHAARLHRAAIQQSFEQYLPDPLAMAKAGRVVESGDYLMLIISPDVDKAVELFEAAVSQAQ